MGRKPPGGPERIRLSFTAVVYLVGLLCAFDLRGYRWDAAPQGSPALLLSGHVCS